ncbi:MAG TPA: hypothetical protein VGO52_16960 [Hyphomonadaceae bacterium]|nr:hypothetical protein [Hyphomonadaceae bacterium]
MSAPAVTREPPARELEIDGLVVVLAAIAFAAIAGLLYFALSYASGAGIAPVAIASAIVAVAIVLAWLASYPHRATMIAVSLVLLATIIYLPRIFVMDGLLLREAGGLDGSRLRVAMGLNVGGVFIIFLGLLVFGFILPLIMSAFAARRGAPGSVQTLDIHVRGLLMGVILVLFPFSSFYDELSFALLRPARTAAVEAMSEIYINTTVAPAEKFPRLACCNNEIHITDNGDRLFFPDRVGSAARGVLYERNSPPPGRLRVLRDYGEGWKLVEFN